jgi:C4-dicarboxylate-specific signal transduction histidine kinase
VIGVAVIERTLQKFEADLRQFDRPYFLVDPQGIVVLSNRSELEFRPLRPVPPETVPLH